MIGCEKNRHPCPEGRIHDRADVLIHALHCVTNGIGIVDVPDDVHVCEVRDYKIIGRVVDSFLSSLGYLRDTEGRFGAEIKHTVGRGNCNPVLVRERLLPLSIEEEGEVSSFL